eukprot:PhM_4_TR8078/c0_g1_i1/m.49569
MPTNEYQQLNVIYQRIAHADASIRSRALHTVCDKLRFKILSPEALGASAELQRALKAWCALRGSNGKVAGADVVTSQESEAVRELWLAARPHLPPRVEHELMTLLCGAAPSMATEPSSADASSVMLSLVSNDDVSSAASAVERCYERLRQVVLVAAHTCEALLDPAWTARAGFTAEICARLSHKSPQLASQACETLHLLLCTHNVARLLLEDGTVLRCMAGAIDAVVSRLVSRRNTNDEVLLHHQTYALSLLLDQATMEILAVARANADDGERAASTSSVCLLIYLPAFIPPLVRALQIGVERHACGTVLHKIQHALVPVLRGGRGNSGCVPLLTSQDARDAFDRAVDMTEVTLRESHNVLRRVPGDRHHQEFLSRVFLLDQHDNNNNNNNTLCEMVVSAWGSAIKAVSEAQCHDDVFDALDNINMALTLLPLPSFQEGNDATPSDKIITRLFECTRRFIVQSPLNDLDRAVNHRVCRLWSRLVCDVASPELIELLLETVETYVLPQCDVTGATTPYAGLELAVHVFATAAACNMLRAGADTVVRADVLLLAINGLRGWVDHSALPSNDVGKSSSAETALTLKLMLKVCQTPRLYVGCLLASLAKIVLTAFAGMICRTTRGDYFETRVQALLPIVCSVATTNVSYGSGTSASFSFSSLLPDTLLAITEVMKTKLQASWVHYVTPSTLRALHTVWSGHADAVPLVTSKWYACLANAVVTPTDAQTLAERLSVAIPATLNLQKNTLRFDAGLLSAITTCAHESAECAGSFLPWLTESRIPQIVLHLASAPIGIDAVYQCELIQSLLRQSSGLLATSMMDSVHVTAWSRLLGATLHANDAVRVILLENDSKKRTQSSSFFFHQTVHRVRRQIEGLSMHYRIQSAVVATVAAMAERLADGAATTDAERWFVTGNVVPTLIRIALMPRPGDVCARLCASAFPSSQQKTLSDADELERGAVADNDDEHNGDFMTPPTIFADCIAAAEAYAGVVAATSSVLSRVPETVVRRSGVLCDAAAVDGLWQFFAVSLTDTALPFDTKMVVCHAFAHWVTHSEVLTRHIDGSVGAPLLGDVIQVLSGLCSDVSPSSSSTSCPLAAAALSALVARSLVAKDQCVRSNVVSKLMADLKARRAHRLDREVDGDAPWHYTGLLRSLFAGLATRARPKILTSDEELTLQSYVLHMLSHNPTSSPIVVCEALELLVGLACCAQGKAILTHVFPRVAQLLRFEEDLNPPIARLCLDVLSAAVYCLGSDPFVQMSVKLKLLDLLSECYSNPSLHTATLTALARMSIHADIMIAIALHETLLEKLLDDVSTSTLAMLVLRNVLHNPDAKGKAAVFLKPVVLSAVAAQILSSPPSCCNSNNNYIDLTTVIDRYTRHVYALEGFWALAHKSEKARAAVERAMRDRTDDCCWSVEQHVNFVLAAAVGEDDISTCRKLCERMARATKALTTLLFPPSARKI